MLRPSKSLGRNIRVCFCVCLGGWIEADGATGGEEERRTLLDAYTASRGDLDVVFETVLASDVVADEARFRTIIDAAIAAGEVEAYTKYTKESAATKKRRRTAAAKEAKLAEAHAKQLGIHDELYAKKKETGEKRKKGGEIEEEDMGGLAAIIKSRQAGRMDAMIAGLEAKIASGGASKGKKKGGRRAQPLPPTDEEFEATRAKMEARKKKRRTKV